MPDELQLLPPDKTRNPDNHILITHLKSLLLLTSTKACREQMQERGVYPIIRELHLHINDDNVEDACDRIVQVLMAEVDLAEDVGHKVEDDENDVVDIL